MKSKGFTLAELLIVVAIIAVLVAIAIPVFTNQLEKSREATDLANARAAYAEVMAAAQEENYKSIEFELVQKSDDWQSADTITIGGITHKKGDENTNPNWQGIPGAEGKCTVSFSVDTDNDGIADAAMFNWEGGVTVPTPVTKSFADCGNLALDRIWEVQNGNFGCYKESEKIGADGISTYNKRARYSLDEPILLKAGDSFTITPGYSPDNSKLTMDMGFFLASTETNSKGYYTKYVDSGWIKPTSNDLAKTIKDDTYCTYEIQPDGSVKVTVTQDCNLVANSTVNGRNSNTITEAEKTALGNMLSITRNT